MELWVTGDRSALSLEANANYFRENLFHRASLCRLGRKDQIYSPRFSHPASFTFLSLFLSYASVYFLFLFFSPKTHCSCSFTVVKAQPGSGTGKTCSFGVTGWCGLPVPSLGCCWVAHSSSHQCHHPRWLLGASKVSLPTGSGIIRRCGQTFVLYVLYESSSAWRRLSAAGTKLNFTSAAKMVAKGLSPPHLLPSSRFPELQRLLSWASLFRLREGVNCHSYQTGTAQWAGDSASNSAPCRKELEGKSSSIFSPIPQPPEEGIFCACFLQLPSLEASM